MATSASNPHKDIQAYSVLANVQKSDPALELATTNSCAGMLYGYGVDCHYPTNHLKRLAGTRAPRSQQTMAAGLPGGVWSPRGACDSCDASSTNRSSGISPWPPKWSSWLGDSTTPNASWTVIGTVCLDLLSMDRAAASLEHLTPCTLSGNVEVVKNREAQAIANTPLTVLQLPGV